MPIFPKCSRVLHLSRMVAASTLSFPLQAVFEALARKITPPFPINRRLCYAFLLVLALFALSQHAFAVISDPFLEEKVKGMEGQIGGWEHNVTVLQTLTFLVVAIGIIVAAIQAVSGRWIRGLVAILSVASALIVAYNQNFYPADYRSFERLAKAARYKVDAFREEVEGFGPLNDAALKEFRKKLGDLKAEIANLEEQTLKGQVPAPSNSTSSFPGINSAYAMDPSSVRAPAWLKNPPKDEKNFYFAGVAEGTSLETARANALANARNIAAKAIETAARRSDRLKDHEELIADFIQAVTHSAEVVDTFVTPNTQQSTYRASALLRLAKSVAGFNAEAFFIDKGLAFDQELVRGIDSDTSNLTDIAQRATEAQRTAVNSGVVYIQIPREEDRPVAEALRQALSQVIAAPGVEKAATSGRLNVVRYFRDEDAALADKVKRTAETFLDHEGYKTALSLENLAGTAVKGAPEQIEIWLGEMAILKPRVYLEVEQGTPQATINKVKSALQSKGYDVPKVEEISGARSTESRVFYYKASDAKKANSLVQSLGEFGVNSSRDSATKIVGPADARPGHFDLRIGKSSVQSSDEGPQ